MIQTLLDTGPLVAFYDRKDAWHEWACQQMQVLQPPLLTCEAVLSEVCFLLQRGGGNPAVVLEAVSKGTLQVDFLLKTEAKMLALLMVRYSDVPMSLADACLVRLSEQHKDSRVFTLDRHFQRYRRFGRQVIPLVQPW